MELNVEETAVKFLSSEDLRAGRGSFYNVQEPVREALISLFEIVRAQQDEISMLKGSLVEQSERLEHRITETRAKTTGDCLKATTEAVSAARRDASQQIQATRSDLEGTFNARLRETTQDLSARLHSVSEGAAARTRAVEDVIEAKMKAAQDSMDVRVTSVEEMFASRSQAVTSFAETRVAGLSSLLESRCDAVLQSADAKLSGVQDALAAQIALSIPKLQQEVKEIAESLVSECRHTIVMDWQSLNVREHKEEIRRELSRQMATIRQDNEKKLKGLQASMQSTLDETTRRALGGPGNNKSAVGDIIWKLRDLETYMTTEIERTRQEFDRRLRDKLDAGAVDEYTARVADIFERMGATVQNDAIGQMHKHAARVNQDLAAHERRMELQIKDLESTRREVWDTLELLRGSHERLEALASRAMDNSSEARRSATALSTQVDLLRAEVVGGAATGAMDGADRAEDEDTAAGLATAVAVQSAANASTTGLGGLLGRVQGLAQQVAACATYAELRELRQEVSASREEAAAAVKELLLETSRMHEEQGVQIRSARLEFSSRLAESLASRASAEALKAAEERLGRTQDLLAEKVRATEAFATSSVGRLSEQAAALDTRTAGIHARVDGLESRLDRSDKEAATQRAALEARVESVVKEASRAASSAVDDVREEVLGAAGAALDRAIQGLAERAQAARTRDTDSLRTEIDILKSSVDQHLGGLAQQLAAARSEAAEAGRSGRAALDDKVGALRAEIEARSRQAESSAAAQCGQLAGGLASCATKEELRRTAESVLETVARRQAQGPAQSAPAGALDELRKAVHKLEDRVSVTELKSDRHVGQLEQVSKLVTKAATLEDVEAILHVMGSVMQASKDRFVSARSAHSGPEPAKQAYSFFGDISGLDGEELGGLDDEGLEHDPLADEAPDDAFGALVEEVDIRGDEEEDITLAAAFKQKLTGLGEDKADSQPSKPLGHPSSGLGFDMPLFGPSAAMRNPQAPPAQPPPQPHPLGPPNGMGGPMGPGGLPPFGMMGGPMAPAGMMMPRGPMPFPMGMPGPYGMPPPGFPPGMPPPGMPPPGFMNGLPHPFPPGHPMHHGMFPPPGMHMGPFPPGAGPMLAPPGPGQQGPARRPLSVAELESQMLKAQAQAPLEPTPPPPGPSGPAPEADTMPMPSIISFPGASAAAPAPPAPAPPQPPPQPAASQPRPPPPAANAPWPAPPPPPGAPLPSLAAIQREQEDEVKAREADQALQDRIEAGRTLGLLNRHRDTYRMQYAPPPTSGMAGSQPGGGFGGRGPFQAGRGGPGRGRPGSSMMSGDEVDRILSIQWSAVHTQAPFMEDYYYQAFIFKYLRGANAASFAPEVLRDINLADPSHRGEKESVAYVQLEGLGKIPFSNIRRPRPLMEIPIDKPDEDEEEEAPEAARRSLDREPLLAARAMCEDCLCVLQDIADVDCMLRSGRAAAIAGSPAELLRRREVLVEGLAQSLRLAATPAAPTAAPGAESPDGVLLRLLGLRKGREMLTVALKALERTPPAGPLVPGLEAGATSVNSKLLWALCRNLRSLFADRGSRKAATAVGDAAVAAAAEQSELIRRTSQVAEAAADLIAALESPRAVLEAVQAAASGDVRFGQGRPGAALLPLHCPDPSLGPDAPWLSLVLSSLLRRAAQVGTPAAFPAEWSAAFDSLLEAVRGHVGTVLGVFRAAVQQGASEAAEYARHEVPVAVIRAAIPHASDDQKSFFREALTLMNG